MTSVVPQAYLGIVDYFVFATVLGISASIGVYFAIVGRNTRTTGEFLVAGRSMPAAPIALSLLASFMSAITLLGTASELYQFGTMYWYITISYVLTIVISTFVFIPVFYEMNLTSSYEYLGARFHWSAQVLSAMSFIFQMSVYMGIVLYAPALALNAVSGFNVWVAVFTVGPISIIYTSIGGIKAVLWTDSFQVFIMFAGLFAVIIKGGIIHGGYGNIINMVNDAHRIEYNNINIDPTTRQSIWSAVIGGTIMWTAIYGVNQTMVQRALTAKSLRTARLAFWMNAPMLVGILTTCATCGLVVIATYKDCDPQSIGRVSASDQLLPLFVMDYLSYMPGLAGLFVAALFSGAMSTVSSGLNSLAAVTLHDVIMLKYPELSEKTTSRLTKGLAWGYGGFCLFFAYISSMLGPILSAALSLFGMMAGPVLGVMTLGMLFPFTNSKGAVAGHIVSQLFTFYVGFGYYAYGVKPPKLPTSVSGCNETVANWTSTIYYQTLNNTARLEDLDMSKRYVDYQEHIPAIHRISYMWYSCIGFFVALIVGLVVSVLTGCNGRKPTKAKYISPVLRPFYRKFPHDSHFGIAYFDNDDNEMDENVKEKFIPKDEEP